MARCYAIEVDHRLKGALQPDCVLDYRRESRIRGNNLVLPFDVAQGARFMTLYLVGSFSRMTKNTPRSVCRYSTGKLLYALSSTHTSPGSSEAKSSSSLLESYSLAFPTTANLGSMFATLATMCSFTAALRWRCFAHFMHQ